MSASTGDGTQAILTLVVIVVTAGCAAGPNFHRPAAPSVKGYTPEQLAAKTAKADVAGGEAQRFVQGQDIPGQWWTLFHSRALNILIEQSLKANPSLTAAQAALRAARENVAAQKGAFYPTIRAWYQLLVDCREPDATNFRGGYAAPPDAGCAGRL